MFAMKQLSQVDPNYKWMQQWRSQIDIGCVCGGGEGGFIHIFVFTSLKKLSSKEIKNAEDE